MGILDNIGDTPYFSNYEDRLYLEIAMDREARRGGLGRLKKSWEDPALDLEKGLPSFGLLGPRLFKLVLHTLDGAEKMVACKDEHPPAIYKTIWYDNTVNNPYNNTVNSPIDLNRQVIVHTRIYIPFEVVIDPVTGIYTYHYREMPEEETKKLDMDKEQIKNYKRVFDLGD